VVGAEVVAAAVVGKEVVPGTLVATAVVAAAVAEAEVEAGAVVAAAGVGAVVGAAVLSPQATRNKPPVRTRMPKKWRKILPVCKSFPFVSSFF